MSENQPNENQQIDIEIQVHLTEYQKTRDEIIHRIESASQSLLISLTSSSVILPILFSQINNVPKLVLGLFLYILAIVYAVIGMHYATSQYYVSVIGNYIYQSLSPKINQRLKTSSKYQVLQAEQFLRDARHNKAALLLSTIGGISIGIIILMPSLLSLLFAQYVIALSASEKILMPALIFNLLSSWKAPLSILAWLFFSLSILSQLLVVIYAAMTGYISSAASKK